MKTNKPVCNDLSEQPDKATPRPWYVSENSTVHAESRERSWRNRTSPSGTIIPVAECLTASEKWIEREEMEANAALIVEAVNAYNPAEHAALVDCKNALKQTLKCLERYVEMPQWDMNDEEVFESGKKALTQLEKA